MASEARIQEIRQKCQEGSLLPSDLGLRAHDIQLAILSHIEGGKDTYSNLQTLCRRCNSKKRNRM